MIYAYIICIIIIIIIMNLFKLMCILIKTKKNSLFISHLCMLEEKKKKRSTLLNYNAFIYTHTRYLYTHEYILHF